MSSSSSSTRSRRTDASDCIRASSLLASFRPKGCDFAARAARSASRISAAVASRSEGLLLPSGLVDGISLGQQFVGVADGKTGAASWHRCCMTARRSLPTPEPLLWDEERQRSVTLGNVTFLQ